MLTSSLCSRQGGRWATAESGRRLVERMGRRRSRKAGTPPSSLVGQSRHQGEGQGLVQEQQELGRKGKVERGRGKGRNTSLIKRLTAPGDRQGGRAGLTSAPFLLLVLLVFHLSCPGLLVAGYQRRMRKVVEDG